MSEPVSIDKLTIDIETNANQAKDGLEKLAKVLGELKVNGGFGTAVTNLNKLSDALKRLTPVTSNANKLSALATSVDQLSKAGSFARVVSQLNKLPGALKGLSGLNIDNSIGEKLEKLAQASAPLSNVKASGFYSMVNALSKIGDVTNKLDDETIGKFAARIKELNTALEPLSNKMTTIQAGLRGINSSARSAGGGVRDFGSDVNTTTLNLASMVTVVRGAIDALRPVIDLFKRTISEAIEWEGIASRFGRGFGTQANEVYSWIQRLNREMGINTQQFMQYSSVFATMLQGFGVNGTDSSKMALGYTELVYDIWAGYNDVYKNFADAAEAVKSAIAGEVEPVRRAGFTIVESTLEQTAANHGLKISLEKATEAQKSYLRYLTLVDQAHTQDLVGTYAEEMGNAEGMVRTLAQQLKSLSQAFGSLFLPILIRVTPWLQTFVELLTQAIRSVAAFFGFEIQPVTWGSGLDGVAGSAGAATDALGDTAGAVNDTTDALKELKNATIGIDELNVISPPTQKSSSDSGSAGAGSGFDGLDVGSLWDESIFEDVKNQVEEIKQKIKGMLPVIAGVATAFAGWSLLNFLKNLDDVSYKLGRLEPVVKNLAKGLVIAGISVAVGKLTWDFTGAYLENGKLGDLAKMLGTTILGTAVAAWLTGPVGAGIVLATSGVVSLSRLVVDVSSGKVDISDPQAIVTGLLGSLETILGGALLIDGIRGGVWTKAITGAIRDGLMRTFGGTSFAWISSLLKAKLVNALGAIGTALAGVSGWAIAVVAAIVGAIVLAVVDYDFTDIGYKVGKAVGNACRVIVDFGKEIGKWISNAFSNAWEWVQETFDINSVWELLNLMFNPTQWITKLAPKLLLIGIEVIPGIFKGIWEGLKNLAGNIKEFVDGFIQGFKDGFEIHSPSKKFVEIGKQLIAGLLEPFSFSAIKEKLSGFWDSIVGFFGGNKAVSEEVAINVSLVKKGWKTVSAWIGSIPVVSQGVKLIKSAWSTIAKWIGNIPTLSQSIKLVKSGWSTVTKWIGTIPVVSQAVKLVKSGWSSVKGWVGTMPTLSAGIKLVKSGWSTVKSWLGNLNFDIGFSLPRIGIDWGSKTFAGFKISYPTGFYTYARGGFPDVGELFLAREAGPELVGKMGSKTTVANNQQIVDGISEGVYAAMVSAMKQSEGSGGQAINVYLDGRQLVSTIEKRQRERGATIMRNGVYAY